MKFKVNIFRTARQEICKILDYIEFERQSPAGARKWYAAFENAMRRLESAAVQFGLAAEDRHVDFECREIYFKTSRGNGYRAIFTIVENEVRILHVRGPSQMILGSDEMGPPFEVE